MSEKTYWNKCGKHQDLVNQLNEDLPLRGASSSLSMEIYRAVCSIYYECNNNGFGNNYSRVYKFFKDIQKVLNEDIMKIIEWLNERSLFHGKGFEQEESEEVYNKMETLTNLIVEHITDNKDSINSNETKDYNDYESDDDYHSFVEMETCANCGEELDCFDMCDYCDYDEEDDWNEDE